MLHLTPSNILNTNYTWEKDTTAPNNSYTSISSINASTPLHTTTTNVTNNINNHTTPYVNTTNNSDISHVGNNDTSENTIVTISDIIHFYMYICGILSYILFSTYYYILHKCTNTEKNQNINLIVDYAVNKIQTR
jgi:hypothetical protein